MTEGEQDSQIAAMVRDRRRLRRTVACLEQKLVATQIGMQNALLAVELARKGGRIDAERDVTFLDHLALKETLEELLSAREQLQETESRLDAC